MDECRIGGIPQARERPVVVAKESACPRASRGVWCGRASAGWEFAATARNPEFPAAVRGSPKIDPVEVTLAQGGYTRLAPCAVTTRAA